MTHRQRDWWVCTCSCHNEGIIRLHVTPCCTWCSHCQRNIAGNREVHEQDCAINRQGMSALQRGRIFSAAIHVYRRT